MPKLKSHKGTQKVIGNNSKIGHPGTRLQIEVEEQHHVLVKLMQTD